MQFSEKELYETPGYADKAMRLMRPNVVAGTFHPPSAENVARAQVYATMFLAEEQRMANLIACSEPPLIRNAPDTIRRWFGETP